ncbi:MAG: class I SAM-dependent methyltransferase [Myxococcota bacterium]|nr:class I SAM-dependent methyltransferase [Myxococcota bacterium]
MDVEISFDTVTGWLAWRHANPWAADRSYIAELVACARRRGIVSAFLGAVPPDRIDIADTNFRESFLADGFSPRFRVVLDHVAEGVVDGIPSQALRLYAPEALTPFALALRGRYPYFHGSEYLPDPESRRRHFPIPHEDLTTLSLPTGRFDAILSNDVFEHVHDLDRALSELARILRPGGILLATFPFAYNRYDTVVKAVLLDGRIEHQGEPEYHANPVDPRGSLVYQIPGWDVLDRARKQGFACAEMRFVSSKRSGICATGLAGIFLMRAVR